MKTKNLVALVLAAMPLPILTGNDGTPDAAGKSGLAKAEKTGHTLLNPTPAKFLRELSTDRPDKTESPYTVDAGRFQIEMDLANYSHDRDMSGGADIRIDAWAIAPVNFKVGLSHRVDLQTVVETYNSIVTRDRITGARTRQSGFGDVTSRLKVNLGETTEAQRPLPSCPS